MKGFCISGIIAFIALMFMVIGASAMVTNMNYKNTFTSNSINKEDILSKLSTIKESQSDTSYYTNLFKSQKIGEKMKNSFTFTDSIVSNDYCYACSGIQQYSVINHYSSVPTYYPDQIQPADRGYGSLVVVGPDNGKTYYFWIKSNFFAIDIEDYYNMKWIGPSILPVYFDNNILSGSYCLKVTTTRSSPYRDVVWCGTAIIAPNQTTTVNIYTSGCPFGCDCC